jgi:hypothetical protein
MEKKLLIIGGIGLAIVIAIIVVIIFIMTKDKKSTSDNGGSGQNPTPPTPSPVKDRNEPFTIACLPNGNGNLSCSATGSGYKFTQNDINTAIDAYRKTLKNNETIQIAKKSDIEEFRKIKPIGSGMIGWCLGNDSKYTNLNGVYCVDDCTKPIKDTSKFAIWVYGVKPSKTDPRSSNFGISPYNYGTANVNNKDAPLPRYSWSFYDN